MLTEVFVESVFSVDDQAVILRYHLRKPHIISINTQRDLFFCGFKENQDDSTSLQFSEITTFSINGVVPSLYHGFNLDNNFYIFTCYL